MAREESDSLEKGNIQERSGVHDRESLGQVDSGLTPPGVPHKDDPLVCLITTALGHSTDRPPALASFVQSLYCRAGFTPWLCRAE